MPFDVRPIPRAALTALLAAVLLAGTPVLAQSSANHPKPARAKPRAPGDALRSQQLAEQANKAYSERRFEESQRLLEAQLALDDGNAAVMYNIACCMGAQEKHEPSSAMLGAAILHGFSDIRRMLREPALSVAREQPAIREVLATWPNSLESQRAATLLRARERFPTYTLTPDPALRVTFLTPDSPASLDHLPRVREELAALKAWADQHVFADALDEFAREERRAGREDIPEFQDPWVVIVLPTRGDFSKWSAERYGPTKAGAMSQLGGVYEHPRKSLVAMDTGSTLRHEFFHVLHWRFLERVGQTPSIFVQEGLASLVEDMDSAQGSLAPVPSWRTNAAQRVLRFGEFPTLAALAAMPQGQFTGIGALRHYGVSRAAFLFLYDRGALDDFVRLYTNDTLAGYAGDPTGIGAFRAALRAADEPAEPAHADKPGIGPDAAAEPKIPTDPPEPIAPNPKKPTNLDKAFRAWLKDLPQAAEEIKPGMASLGVTIESAEGEGVRIAAVPAKSAGSGILQAGDVITALNGRGTRDIAELVRVLGSLTPGARATLDIRRKGELRTVSMKLGTKN